MNHMNKMKQLPLLLLTACCLMLSACSYSVVGVKSLEPSEAVSNVTTKFNTLHSINTDLICQIILTQHKQEGPSIVLSGPKNYVDVIETYYCDGELSLHMPPNTCFTKFDALRVLINVHDLQSLHVHGVGDVLLQSPFEVKQCTMITSGSGDLESTAPFRFDNLTLSSSGASDVTLRDVVGQHIEVSTSGAGDVKLIGVIDKANFSTSGAGDINGTKLSVQNAHLHASGVGDISCRVVKTLSADASGLGDIIVYGNPSIENIGESGMSDVKVIQVEDK